MSAPFVPTGATPKNVVDSLNEGLTLDYRQLKTIAGEYCDGKNQGHVTFGINNGRLDPEDLISKLEQSKTKEVGFLFLLSYLIRNGLDVNYYIPIYGVVNAKVHLAAFIATRVYTGRYADCIYDLLKTAGCSFLLPAYTGSQNKQNDTVDDIIKKNSPGKSIIDPDKTFDLDEIIKSKPGEFVIKWVVMKEILLDQKFSKGSTDVLSFVRDLSDGKKFVMRSIICYLTSRSFSINCIRETDDRDLILNTSGNMCQSVYFAILSQNLEYFKIVIDKGGDCDYLCMTELISRHNEASENKDKILVDIFGEMIVYAISRGSEIDAYQVQFLSLHASVDLIERIRDSYREPEWKKLCSRVTPGETKQLPVKRLRQIALDLNLDFSLSPTFICDKLDQISNMDRLEFATKSIERQEERVERILLEAGQIKEGDPIEKRKCNPKSMIINNPYAYTDARMAFYKDDTGELWCFTSDFFESMIESEKNPYTGKKLPTLFLETIKAQMNILRFLDLASPKDSKNMGEAVSQIFDGQKEISNYYSDSIYARAVNIILLLGVRRKPANTTIDIALTETDIRSIALSKKDTILRDFINLSFYFSVDSENNIDLDFTKEPTRLVQDIIKNFGPDQIISGGNNAFGYVMRTFLIPQLFHKVSYLKKIPSSGFNELFFRIISYHIIHFYKKYKNGVYSSTNSNYYTAGTDPAQLSTIFSKIFN